MKRKFFDTGYAKFAGLSSHGPRVLKYIIENRNCILPISELVQLAQNVRMILKTPMAEFFDRIISSQGLDNFMAYYLQNSNNSIPELLTINSISLDLKQLDTTGILRSVPEARDKIAINLSSIIKCDKSTGRYTVSAVDVFQNMFDRGYLVASYEDSDGWLSPYLGEFVTKTYSMIISSLISRYYDLTINETMTVMGILALYITQKLDTESGDPTMPALFNRCTFIGNRSELANLSEACAETSVKGLTLEDMCNLIAQNGPEKLHSFNLGALYTLASNLGPDVITTQIALEYPPYWVYMLMLALSGNKIPIVYQLTSQRLANEGRSRFLQQLNTDAALFKVRRG